MPLLDINLQVGVRLAALVGTTCCCELTAARVGADVGDDVVGPFIGVRACRSATVGAAEGANDGMMLYLCRCMSCLLFFVDLESFASLTYFFKVPGAFVLDSFLGPLVPFPPPSFDEDSSRNMSISYKLRSAEVCRTKAESIISKQTLSFLMVMRNFDFRSTCMV